MAYTLDWRSLPPLAALRAFAALAQTGSASAAGAALNVTHAAVSQQLRKLETHLGVPLVQRDGRGLALTPAGESLAAVLLESFGQIAVQAELISGAGAGRPLQVTTTPNFAANWLIPRLAGFRAAHQQIELMLNPTPDLSRIGPGGADLGIRFGSGGWSGVEAEPLLSSSFVIIAATSLIGDRQVTHISELLDLPWLQELGTEEVLDWLARHGVTEARVRAMTHLPGNFILDAVRRGEGVSATARAFAEPDIKAGRIRVLFEDSAPGSGYWIVTAPGVQRPETKAFLRWLRSEADGWQPENAEPVP